MENFKINIKQPEITATQNMLDSMFNGVSAWINSLPLFSELGMDDISELLKKARFFRKFQNVIIFGVGGSCLGGKLLANFEEHLSPKIHFFDNIDSYEWNKLFKNIDINTTGIISISKSGNTTETIFQTLMAIQKWNSMPLSDHFLFITDNEKNALREIAEVYDIECVNHPAGIGGRFSVFSIVGLLPALIAGVDVQKVIDGAKGIVSEFLNSGPNLQNKVLENALFFDQLFKNGINISILFCYANSLLYFADWYNQLFAESLGKHSNNIEELRYGMTSVTSLGTVAQHSQLQLYIDGPKDKCFTIISIGNHQLTDIISIENLANPIAKILRNHSMAELMKAHQQVTMQTLIQNRSPLRWIHIPNYNEESVGELLMFSILEILAIGKLWGIDPFSQPGVKNGKISVIEMMKSV
jgi:glucose-6-phosphate isomerase